MRKNQLNLRSNRRAPWDRKFRLMRGPEGHADAGQQNDTGNSGDSGQGGGEGQNNGGQSFTGEGFWNDPQASGNGSGDSNNNNGGQNNGNGNQQQQQQDPGRTTGAEIASRIDGLNFGDFFTPQHAEAIANGDFAGINGAMNNAMRQAVREGLVTQAQLLKPFAENLVSQVKSLIAESLGSEKNNETLINSFAAAKDPRTRPIVEKVFNQSLKNCNGDRDKAVEMTREMLKLVGTTAASDFGIEQPTSGRGDNFMVDGAQSLVDSLLSKT